MSLRTAVAAPFRTEGVERMGESEFVVALSLDRGWFSPDQAKRLVDVAASEGLIEREDGDLVSTFEPGAVDVPEGFTPDEGILRQRSTFERLLAAITDAGVEKQTAVAGVNAVQADLGLTLEAAGVLYARREGVAVGEIADQVRREL